MHKLMLESLESLETPVHSAEKKLVLEAISGTAGKITVADIATITNLPVLRSGALLNQIAYETGGHLTVGSSGSVVYEFDPNFENAYITRSSKNLMLRCWRIIANASMYAARMFALAMFFLIRVSFGIALILSVVAIVVLVVVAITALLSQGRGDSDDDNFNLGGLFDFFGGIMRYWAFDWIWDWWYWGDYLRWDPYPYDYYRNVPTTAEQQQHQQATAAQQSKRANKESFLDKCFSFLFGDGNPNIHLEEQRWRNIASVLKANNGVVVAEQLAPFVDQTGKNEDWVLPILVRFNGTCDVSESGNIVYTFPSFKQARLAIPPQEQVSKNSNLAQENNVEELHDLFRKHLVQRKMSKERNAAQAAVDHYLKESPWELSHVSGGTRATIICLAVLIMLGGLWLTSMSVVVPFLLPLTPLLLAIAAYGSMFLVIPGIRWIVIQNINKGIEHRNSIRYTAYHQLTSTEVTLQRKLGEAAEIRRKAVEESSAETVTYTTNKDYLEQQFESPNEH